MRSRVTNALNAATMAALLSCQQSWLMQRHLIILFIPLFQPCSPHNHQSEVTSPPSACGNRWAHYSRNTVPRNRFIQTSNYAEQNHWSIAANAPDDPDRSLEQNIVDIMERDKTLADTRQKAQYKWKAVENTHLNDMPRERANDLTLARENACRKSV